MYSDNMLQYTGRVEPPDVDSNSGSKPAVQQQSITKEDNSLFYWWFYY
jgi:hypothetical protein